MALPEKLFWIDAETTGVDKNHDIILELGVVITDLDLNPLGEYQQALTITDAAKRRLAADPFVFNMHKENGLLKAARDSFVALHEAEQEIIGLLWKVNAEPGKILVAGSGVTRFDHHLIERDMLELATWFPYYSLDIGSVRRAAWLATGGHDVFPSVPESFKSGHKAHRALADVYAHIKEAEGQWAVFRKVAGQFAEKAPF